jgi:hypothetical protein
MDKLYQRQSRKFRILFSGALMGFSLLGIAVTTRMEANHKDRKRIEAKQEQIVQE